MRKITFLILLFIPFLLRSQTAEPILHVQRYLGKTDIIVAPLNQRNAVYWSAGTDVDGKGYIKAVRQVCSSGIAQADFRICTYEDGSPVFEDGKYYFCASARLAGIGAVVFSYSINTSAFTLVGCLQGYGQDGEAKPLIAPHILYNRNDRYWYVFAHWGLPHHICVGKTLRDPRFGRNEITTDILDYEGPVKGDEDSFVFFDEESGKWVLVYSKASTTVSVQYSSRIDGGYRQIVATQGIRSLTGINVVRIGGRRYVVTGFGLTPEQDAYKVFRLEDLSPVCDLDLDFPTGGFRGWGTLFGVVEGEQTKYQLLTFDRINPVGTHRWNYGNIYLYEARERNPGMEYDFRYPDGQVVKARVREDYSPSELHFVRKFSKRLNFSQELPMGELDLDGRVFLPLGNPYPVKDSTGAIRCQQATDGIRVQGKGSFSLLGGSHYPGAEDVLDLTGLSRGETRFLTLGTPEQDLVTVGFRSRQHHIEVLVNGREGIRIPEAISFVRIVTSGTSLFFVDATSIP